MLFFLISVLIISINLHKHYFSMILIYCIIYGIILVVILVIISKFKYFTLYFNFSNLLYYSILNYTTIIYIDYISLNFIGLVSAITLLVYIYIGLYMKNEAEILKFNILINIFSISMMGLVVVNNIFFFFLLWEIIGLVSFFLINFYYFRTGVNKASLKVFFFNKFSDMFIFVYIILSTFDYNINYEYNILTLKFLLELISLCLAGSIKSSQLGFHIWLPDSMEAPAPASALIHSATLVSIGVYLYIRLFELIISCYLLYYFLILWFSTTGTYGGLVAAFQTDIKRLLAYSTISHCGLLCTSAMIGNTNFSLLYLILHGLFKAILFLLVGKLIISSGTQDLRYMGFTELGSFTDNILVIIIFMSLAALPGSLGLYYKFLFLINTSNKYYMYIIVFNNYISCLIGISYVWNFIKYIYSSQCSLVILKKNKYISVFYSQLKIILIILIIIVNTTIYIYLLKCNIIELISLKKLIFLKVFYINFIINILIINIVNKNIHFNYKLYYFIIYIIFMLIINCGYHKS